MKKVGLLVLAIVCNTVVFAQETIFGHVVDSQEREPLSGAIIHILNKKGETIQYQICDSKGNFNIEIPSKGESIKIVLLGYKEQIIKRPFSTPLLVRMESMPRSILESRITANKVLEAGDTIRYNVNLLKRPEDRKLSDFLSRLPGIEVDNSGLIKYNGKEINRFYVDGRDILSRNYNLATTSMSLDLIQDIEILENHQPIQIMRGVKDSETAAINIIMAHDAKGRGNYEVTADAGVETVSPFLTAMLDVSSLYLMKKFSSINCVEYDDLGYGRMLSSAAGQNHHRNRREITRHIGTEFSFAPLSEGYANIHREGDAMSVSQISFSPTTSLSFSLAGGMGKKWSNAMTTSTYHSSGQEDWVMSRHESMSMWTKRMVVAGDFEKNSKKFYLKNRSSFSYVKDSLKNIINNENLFFEQTDRRQIQFENETLLVFKGERGVWSAESYTQLLLPKEFCFLDENNMKEDSRRKLFYQYFSLSGFKSVKGHWLFSVYPEMSITRYDYDTKAQGNIFGIQKESGKVFNYWIGAGASTSYRISPIEWKFSTKIGYSYFNVSGEKERGVTGNARLSGKYISGRWGVTVGIEGGLKAPDIQSLGSGLLLTGFYTLWRPSSQVTYTPYYSIDTEFLAREPVSGWNFRLYSRYESRRNILYQRELTGQYVITSPTNQISPFRTVVSTLEVTKGLFSQNGRLRFSLSHIWRSSSLIQNSSREKYDAHILSPRFEGVFSITKSWGCEAGIFSTFSSWIAGAGGMTLNMDVMARIVQKIYLPHNWRLEGAIEGYYSKIIKKPMILPDISLAWQCKKNVEISFKCRNLLNQKYYTYRMLSPLQEDLFSYEIRPFTATIGVRWQI